MQKARILYNSEKDQFEVQINTGDGWGLDTAYKCVAREGGDGTANFISWRIIAKLEQLQTLGYSIKYGGVL